MRKRKNIIIALLVFCLAFPVIPGNVQAEEAIAPVAGEPADAESSDDGLEEEPSEEAGNQEGECPEDEEALPENDAPESTVSEENAENVQDGQEEAESDIEEEEALAAAEKEKKEAAEEEEGRKGRKLENNDPGWGRYSGYAAAEFYGPSSRARADTVWHDGRFSGYVIQKGIDVSEFNGNINWKKVKAAGYDFAIIRVAGCWARKQGGYFMDNRAIQNIEGALAAGMEIGVYFFSQAISEKEAKAEANYILKAIKPYKSSIKLPVVFDFEYYSDSDGLGGRLYDAKLSKAKATKVCNAFCTTVKNAGYTPMLYANLDMIENHLNASALNSTFWLAQWASSATYSGDYEYWQYSDRGKVPGMTGNVDLNFRYIQRGPLRIASRGINSLKLEWDAVEGASGYDIYRKDSSGTYQFLASAEGGASVSYMDRKLKEGTAYTYRVRSYSGTEEERQNGYYTKGVTGITRLSKTVLKGSAAAFDTVKLSWKKVAGVSGYQLQRYDSAAKAYKGIKTIGGSTTVSYKNVGLNAGKTYRYRIRAYKNVKGIRTYGSWSDAVKVRTKGNAKGTVTHSNVNVRSGAGTSYRVLTQVGKNKKLTLTGSSGNWYRISVKIKGKTRNAYISKDYVKVNKSSSKPGKPVLKVARKSAARLRLTWKKISGAAGYQIQRYDSSKKAYTTIKTIKKGTTVSYTNSGLKAGKTYKYRIRAYKIVKGNKVYGAYSTARSVKTSK